MKNTPLLCTCAVVVAMETQNVEKRHLAPSNLAFNPLSAKLSFQVWYPSPTFESDLSFLIWGKITVKVLF